jgi:phage/conjugal plasmid C-4 type zinc finger TraR family protein
MASGWAPDGAVQDQIDDSITDAVRLARSRLPEGPGEIYCRECGEEIPEARRRALPGARTCVDCQAALDRPASSAAYNRRGSKDSQLK